MFETAFIAMPSSSSGLGASDVLGFWNPRWVNPGAAFLDAILNHGRQFYGLCDCNKRMDDVRGHELWIAVRPFERSEQTLRAESAGKSLIQGLGKCQLKKTLGPRTVEKKHRKNLLLIIAIPGFATKIKVNYRTFSVV
jgi:hypothetical protein